MEQYEILAPDVSEAVRVGEGGLRPRRRRLAGSIRLGPPGRSSTAQPRALATALSETARVLGSQIMSPPVTRLGCRKLRSLKPS